MTQLRIAVLFLTMMITPVLAGPPPSSTLHPEQSERNAFKSRISEMLRLGQFDDLERLAQNLIADDPRYSCGVSKLVDFYDALGPASDSGPDGPEARTATFTAWAQAKPSSYLPKAGFSRVEVWRAWKSRGNGVARDTSPDQWDGHARHMKAALEWGRKALADNPRDPQLLTEMIGVCRDAKCPREDADRWLAAAIAMNPNYDAAYIPMANTLDPRWDGTPEEFEAFAEQASDDNMALGDIVYARIASVGLLMETNRYKETFPALQWERIQHGLREIDKRYPDSARTWHVLARFASVYGDHAVAREAMNRLSTEWDADAATYWDNPITFGRARRWAMDDAPPASPMPIRAANPRVGERLREYGIPNHGKLVLSVPASVLDASAPLSEPPSVQLRFRPQTGAAFDVQMVSVWLDAAKLKATTPELIKELAAKGAAELLPHAVEKEAPLRELHGSETRGFFYSLTDRAPGSGEYKYMSQGGFVTGEVMTAFTILHRDPACAECEQVLRMFAAAKYSQ